jgi:hypothetical protein
LTGLHALMGPLLMALLLGLAICAVAAAFVGRMPNALEWIRRALLAVVVAQAAIGLALAVRGDAPAEGIHWIYGGAIVVALLAPGALRPELPARTRTGALAAGAVLAVIFAWRLGASG